MSATITIDPAELRSIVKDAVAEALSEKFDAVQARLVEDYEDQCLVRAIEAVDPSDRVSRDEIVKILYTSK